MDLTWLSALKQLIQIYLAKLKGQNKHIAHESDGDGELCLMFSCSILWDTIAHQRVLNITSMAT